MPSATAGDNIDEDPGGPPDNDWLTNSTEHGGNRNRPWK